MTDLLGICTTWGDGACIVVSENGESVRIELSDIVSGKPVPPRPSARHRVSPYDAQSRALALFPDLVTEQLGDWLLRRSATADARRANSVLAFGEPGRLDVEDAINQVVAFYERSPASRPIAAVLPDSAAEMAFRQRGWTLESHDADTLFQLAGVAQVRRRLGGAATTSTVHLDETGGLAQVRCQLDGVEIASGVAAYDRDWVGFRSIEVAAAHRRGGHGLAVMAALLDWGAEQGATTAYLQVLADNTAGLGLYRRLGFSTHHDYRYLAAPPLIKR